MTITRECFKQKRLKAACVNPPRSRTQNKRTVPERTTERGEERTDTICRRQEAVARDFAHQRQPRPTVNTVNPSLGLLPRPTEKDTLYGAILSQLVTGRRSSGAL